MTTRTDTPPVTPSPKVNDDARRPILHPLLAASFVVLSLYATNVDETPASALVGPMAVICGGAVALWLVLRRVYRDDLKAGVLTTALVLWFFSYGQVFDAYGNGMRERYLLPVWAGLLALMLVGIGRTRRRLRNMNRVLNVMAVALVAVPLGRICLFVSTVHAKEDASVPFDRSLDAQLAGAAAPPPHPAAAPDIYYIILDSYTSARNLSRYCGRSNEAFADSLARKGFYVAADSHSNYAFTLLSVPSSLNAGYMNFLREQMGAGSKDLSLSSEFIRDNAVSRFLSARGYRCIQIQPPIRSGPAEIWRILGKTTILHAFDRFDFDGIRERTLETFHQIEEMAPVPGPKFVYAHIYCPHAPYVFGPRGEAVKAPWKQELHLVSIPEQARMYADEVEFLNQRTQALVDSLIARSAAPPVIVIQGDHGPHDLTLEWPPTEDCVRQRMGILNAYHLPGLRPGELYPSITPVNTFRVILNHYFGAACPLLPDRSFYSTYRAPYGLIDVTDRLRHNT